MIKTSLSSAGVVGSIPGQGEKIPLVLGQKNQNIKKKKKKKLSSNIVAKSMKTFKKLRLGVEVWKT